MLIPVLIFAALTGHLAPAAVDGTPRAAMIHRVAAYTDSTRQTEGEYAEWHHLNPDEMRMMTSPVGQIKCGRGTGTASLVESDKVIVTAMHIACTAHVEPNQCTFTYRDAATQEHIVSIKSVAGKGGDCSASSPVDDWMVLELSKPALGTTPYSIEDSGNPLKTPRQVNVIGDSAIDFCLRSKLGQCIRIRGTKEFKLQRFIDGCEIKYIAHTNGVPNEHITNCGAAPGTSGSPVTLYNKPVLLGVIIATQESSSDREFERRTGTPITKEYTLEGTSPWYTTDVAIAGKLAETIKKAAQAERDNQK